MMERSKAIKSPSIHYHLAGTKKVRDNHVMRPFYNDSVQVQQELARPGRLERFLTDEDQIRQVRRLFTGLYSLDQVIIQRRMSVVSSLLTGCYVRTRMVTPMSGQHSPAQRGLC